MPTISRKTTGLSCRIRAIDGICKQGNAQTREYAPQKGQSINRTQGSNLGGKLFNGILFQPMHRHNQAEQD